MAKPKLQCRKCGEKLGPFAQPDNLLCYKCQKEWVEFRSVAKTWLNSRTLPEEWIRFIFDHQDGCLTCDLADILNKDLWYVTKCMTRGVIKGHKGLAKNRCSKQTIQWIIPPEELVRVFDIFYNWTELQSVIDRDKVDRCTASKYAREGEFGLTKNNLEGHRMILNCVATNFRQRFEEVKTERLQRKPKYRRHRGKITHTPARAAKILKVGHSTINRFTDTNLLPCIRIGKGRTRLIKDKDLRDFIEQVVNGAKEVSSSYFNTKYQKHWQGLLKSQLAA